MLRVYTPASPNPTNSGRTTLTRFSHAEGLRRQIVDMVQKQGLTTADTVDLCDLDLEADPVEQISDGNTNVPHPHPGVIYQIKKKGGIASVRQANPKTDKKNDKLKKIHLKILRETRGKGCKSYSASVDPSADITANVKGSDLVDDPDKKPTSFSGFTNVELVQKHLKPLPMLKPEQSKENKDPKDKTATGNKMYADTPNINVDKYEIRGNAIKSAKVSKSAPIQRSSEASRRHMTIHNSLQLFKRRLKVSQPDFYIQQKVSTNESDYVIRRVPLKYEFKGNKPVASQSPAPLEPRLKLNSATGSHRSKTSTVQIPTAISPHPLMPMSRPNSGTDRDRINTAELPEKKIRCSYRLPDNINWSKEVSFRDETEMIPNVNTYVLEQAKRSGTSKFDGQATLSTHNVDVHNALTSTSESKVKLGENNEEFDSRFLKWLEDTNTSSNKNTHRTTSAPVIKFRADADQETIEILEFRSKTPHPEKESNLSLL